LGGNALEPPPASLNALEFLRISSSKRLTFVTPQKRHSPLRHFFQQISSRLPQQLEFAMSMLQKTTLAFA
jgi:hypothetical protein